MDGKQNGCTCFFDTWFKWGEDMRIESFDLSSLCNNHDLDCGSHSFLSELQKNRVVGTYLIWLFASIGCWVKYPLYMWSRL